MKIVYISHITIPSYKASSIQIMKMCNAFAHNACEVILLVPFKKDKIIKGIDDIYDFYDVAHTFEIVKVPHITFPLTLLSRRIAYNLLTLKYIKKYKPDLVYGRSIIGCTLAAISGYKVRLELHNKLTYKRDWLFFNFLIRSKNLEKIVVITNNLKKYYENKYSIDENKIIVVPDGADQIDNYEQIADLGGRKNVLKVGYVGSLYTGKGLEIILELALKIPEVDFYIIGGLKNEIEYWKSKVKTNNIYFHGFINQKKLPLYINALDICLLPNQNIVTSSIKENITLKENFGDFTSPIKLFQYMAHKKPIVASDLPVIREVLNDNNAILVAPHNIDGWVSALNRLKNKDLRKKIANAAHEDFLDKYTWIKRAKKVLE